MLTLAVATALRFYFVSWLGERTVADIRQAVQRNLLRLAPGFFEENRPSEIASRMTSDTTIIEQVVGTTVSVALRNTVMGIGGIAYLFTLSPKLTGGILLGIPVIIMPIVLLGRRLHVARSARTVSPTSAPLPPNNWGDEDRPGFRQRNARPVARQRSGDLCQPHPPPRDHDRDRHRSAVQRDLLLNSTAPKVSPRERSPAARSPPSSSPAGWSQARSALTGVYGDLLRPRAAERLSDYQRQTSIARPRSRAPFPNRRAALEFATSNSAIRHAPTRLPRLQPGDPAARNGRDRRPVGRRQIDLVPARRTLLRSTGSSDPARQRPL